MEEWRKIENVLVSNSGKCNKKLYVYNKHYLRPFQNGKGIHELVAMAFPEICGEWFEGCQVHHVDHNTKNNRADNLIVLTKEEHIKIHQESEITRNKKRNFGERNGFYGKCHTDETKEKMRQKKLGTKRSDATKEKIRNSMLGKTHSDETKLKISESKKKKKGIV